MVSILVFDIWGEYAHFRKYFTTTSPLTYSLPPRTALCGLMGAILGYSKEDYLHTFPLASAMFGIQLMEPVKKIRFSENLIDTESIARMNIIKQHTRIKFEFLKAPRYRVYFSHTDPTLMDKARKMLAAHQCVYTPCLGISEHIANFAYVGEHAAELQENSDPIPIYSAIRDDQIIEVIFESQKEYMTETFPNEMTEDRTVTEYQQFMFERNCKPILAKVKKYYRLDNGENIVIM